MLNNFFNSKNREYVLILMKLSLPIMLSNLLQTVYNLTDAFWLGKMGNDARGAVSVVGVAFPLVFFVMSFGYGFVIAGTSLIAQFKGAKNKLKMKAVVVQFFWINIGFSLLFLLIGLFLLDSILWILKTPLEIFEDAKEYISIIVVGMFFMIPFLSYQGFSNGLGDTVSPMKIQIISIFCNLILDPIMIFGFGFVPRMEIKGAAYATLISRIIAFLLAIYFFKSRNKVLIPEFRDLKINKTLMKKILFISFPASLAQSMTSFGFLLLQGFVNCFGTVVITIYSIGNRLTSFYMMPAMGISNALTTIVGQNLGAKSPKKAEENVWIAMILVLVIMTIGGIILFFLGGSIIKIFINDSEVIKAGGRMLKITTSATFIFGIMFVFTGAFNGAGYTKASMKFNISRLWLFRIPLVFILSGKIMNFSFVRESIFAPLITFIAYPLSEYPYDALWWSMIISNSFASIWAYLIFRKGTWKNHVSASI